MVASGEGTRETVEDKSTEIENRMASECMEREQVSNRSSCRLEAGVWNGTCSGMPWLV